MPRRASFGFGAFTGYSSVGWCQAATKWRYTNKDSLIHQCNKAGSEPEPALKVRIHFQLCKLSRWCDQSWFRRSWSTGCSHGCGRLFFIFGRHSATGSRYRSSLYRITTNSSIWIWIRNGSDRFRGFRLGVHRSVIRGHSWCSRFRHSVPLRRTILFLRNSSASITTAWAVAAFVTAARINRIG